MSLSQSSIDLITTIIIILCFVFLIISKLREKNHKAYRVIYGLFRGRGVRDGLKEIANDNNNLNKYYDQNIM